MLVCPAPFVPVDVRETGTKGAGHTTGAFAICCPKTSVAMLTLGIHCAFDEYIGDFSPTGRNNADQSSVWPTRELTQTSPRMRFKMARSCVFEPGGGQASHTRSIGVGADAKDRKRGQRGYICS
jgi:hypothetical protein